MSTSHKKRKHQSNGSNEINITKNRYKKNEYKVYLLNSAKKHNKYHSKNKNLIHSESVRKLDKSGDLLKFMENISDEYEKINELNKQLTKLIHSDKELDLKHFLINEINFYNDTCIKEITRNFNEKCREGVFIPIVSEAEWTEITTKKWKMYFAYMINIISGLATSDFISIVTSILDILKSVKFGDLSQKFHKTTFISICLENEHTKEDTVTMLFFALRIKRRTKKKNVFFFDHQSDVFSISLCLFMAHAKKNIKEITDIKNIKEKLTISEDLTMLSNKKPNIELNSFYENSSSSSNSSTSSSNSSILSDSFT